MKCLGLGLMVLVGTAFGQGNLKESMAKLDASSLKFVSAQATVHKDLYTAVAHDTEAQNGSVFFQKSRSGMDVGLKLGAPDEKTLLYENGVAKVLQRQSQGMCVSTYQASGHQAIFDTFISLGFGGSGNDLQKNWIVSDEGSEVLNGVKVEKLNLVSKDQGVLKTYTHVEVWLDLDHAVSLKQVFYTPQGDTQTAFFSNIRRNEKVDKGPYKVSGPACSK